MTFSKFVFVILAFVLMTSLSAAQTLKLVTLEYPPYEYTENGEVKGMAVDIVKLIFKEMNQPISIEVLPWSKAIKYIEDGERDAIFTAFKNPKRELFADYSANLMPQIVSLFVKKGSMIAYDGDLSLLSKYSIGVIKKVSYGKVLDTAIANKVFEKVVVSGNGTENFQNLVAGKVDIVASNKYGGLYILKQLNKLDAAVELPKRLQTVSSYMAFSKKRNLSHIRDQFNVILKRLKKDGTYVNMLKSYFKK